MLTLAKSLFSGLGGMSIALVAGLTIGSWLGYSHASGNAAQEKLDLALQYTAAWQSAIETAHIDAEAETRRAVSAAEERVGKVAVAQGVTHEITTDTDLSCEWREPHRVRVEALYGAYGYAPDGTRTSRMSD